MTGDVGADEGEGRGGGGRPTERRDVALAVGGDSQGATDTLPGERGAGDVDGQVVGEPQTRVDRPAAQLGRAGDVVLHGRRGRVVRHRPAVGALVAHDVLRPRLRLHTLLVADALGLGPADRVGVLRPPRVAHESAPGAGVPGSLEHVRAVGEDGVLRLLTLVGGLLDGCERRQRHHLAEVAAGLGQAEGDRLSLAGHRLAERGLALGGSVGAGVGG